MEASRESGKLGTGWAGLAMESMDIDTTLEEDESDEFLPGDGLSAAARDKLPPSRKVRS